MRLLSSKLGWSDNHPINMTLDTSSLDIAQKAYRAFGFDGYELNPQMGKALFWEQKL